MQIQTVFTLKGTMYCFYVKLLNLLHYAILCHSLYETQEMAEIPVGGDILITIK